MARQFDKFVDHVSHEFRTPLTVIKEYSSLLHDGIVGDINVEQRRLLQVIEERADDLTTMVDDMLDGIRLDSGKLSAWRKPCGIAEILELVRPSLERKAAVCGVTLEVTFPDGLPEVFCDPEQAGRIVLKLAVNAVKYCGDPGLIRITCREQPADGEVVIDVTDNGPGISPESISQIFRRYKQLSGRRRGSTKGFGLGLSIARELAELNLGEMRVTSELGIGSTFSCALPVSDPVEVLRRQIRRSWRQVVALFTVHVPPSTTVELRHAAHAFLTYFVQCDDLLFRIGDREWLLATNTPADDYPNRLQTAFESANRNRPHNPLPVLNPSVLGVFDAAGEPDLLLAAVRVGRGSGAETRPTLSQQGRVSSIASRTQAHPFRSRPKPRTKANPKRIET